MAAVLHLAVVPRAARDRVGPWRDGVLHVRVTRPAAEDEANRAVLRLVARAIGIAPSRLRITGGATSRRKRLAVGGLDAEQLALRLRPLAD